ncbi:MAG: hypothetical protein LBV26_03000 [Bacteroidales bacterium]|jgi:hypothetical protein|nr:hypothetical protein [Bacteroidales bacterium]
MPYRRLPNTDAARIRAIKTALQKAQELPPGKLAFSAKLIVELRRLCTVFESSVKQCKYSSNIDNRKSSNYPETVRKARIYITHFIRVMNMAISRGELPAEIRTFYGIDIDELNAPALISENEIASWGKRIIEGEEMRIRKGGNPITNPTIAVVKVWYEKFMHALYYNNINIKRINDFMEKNIQYRKEVDELIVQLWNEVEKSHLHYTEDMRKKLNEEYGLVYFYRKNELIKIEVKSMAS